MAARPKGDCLRVNEYVAGGEIKIGAFVTIASSGKVVEAAPGNALLGVSLDYARADNSVVKVADHPEQELLVQKSSSAPSAQTDYFLNYNIADGTDSGLISGHSLDSASGSTASTLPLRAVGPSKIVGSTSECVVQINNHVSKSGVEGV